MRKHPHLIQINASFFLSRMRVKYGRALTLATIPDDEWQVFKDLGFDWLWLMGIWTRSPSSRNHALHEETLKIAYERYLPGWTAEDVGGSPYAVYGYDPDPFLLGDSKALSQLRRKLSQMGLSLMLDFVPNHLAIDHPWTLSDPGLFVRPGRKTLKEHPDWFFKTPKGDWLAHGRDPYFSPWIDTVQVNFYSPETREALTKELLRVAAVSDGVRCDMAMLGLNSIFEKVWGECVRERKSHEEFWPPVIAAVKKEHPDFTFMAEVYWDLEWDLQQLGFDFTYDKKMYDRLKSAPASDVGGHLLAEEAYQNRSVRFLENHDEDRAVYTFGREKSQAAAAVTATVPGLRFFQDGQLDGKRVRTPIHLRREAPDKIDYGLVDFYRMLLAYANTPACHHGKWKFLAVQPVCEENITYRNLIAWSWETEEDWRLVVVNYSEYPSQCRVDARALLGKDKTVRIRDRRSGEIYKRDRDELASLGLYIDLKAWHIHLFEPG
ncbi:MAG: alpha-amylase family glycosyl hydrolase [Candidatus Omnitrophota bacterium]|jgi:glycosidase